MQLDKNVCTMGFFFLISQLLMNVYGHEKIKYTNRQKDLLIVLLNFVPRIYSFKVLIKVSW